MLHSDVLRCPAGFPRKYLVIIASDSAINEVDYADDDHIHDDLIRPNALTGRCKQQLQQYFDHQLFQFDLPLWQHCSPFCGLVYAQLLTIPYGETRAYSTLAQHIRDKNMSRAVGHACSKNHISIIVPCHRVISAQGALTGYAGGLNTKAWLLEHERQR